MHCLDRDRLALRRLFQRTEQPLNQISQGECLLRADRPSRLVPHPSHELCIQILHRPDGLGFFIPLRQAGHRIAQLLAEPVTHRHYLYRLWVVGQLALNRNFPINGDRQDTILQGLRAEFHIRLFHDETSVMFMDYF